MKALRKICSAVVILAMLVGFQPVGVQPASANDSVMYIYYELDSTTDTLIEKTETASNYKVVDENDTTWGKSDNNDEESWYVAQDNITIDGQVTINGDVHLILTDGCTLTVKGGIVVNDVNSLSIYATSEGENMGRLIAGVKGEIADRAAGIGQSSEADQGEIGAITIHGGNVTAQGGESGDSTSAHAGPGIGCLNYTSSAGENLIIYGGKVFAQGGGATGEQAIAGAGIKYATGITIRGKAEVKAMGGTATAENQDGCGISQETSGEVFIGDQASVVAQSNNRYGVYIGSSCQLTISGEAHVEVYVGNVSDYDGGAIYCGSNVCMFQGGALKITGSRLIYGTTQGYMPILSPGKDYSAYKWRTSENEPFTSSETQGYSWPSTDTFVEIVFGNKITIESAEHGSATASETVAAPGELVTLSATPDAHYSLSGWTVSANTVQISEQNTFAMPKADVTITPVFALATYNVTFETNGGTINNGNMTEYTYGTGATLPTDVTRDGYIFAGWYDNASFTGTAVTMISDTDDGDKTYYAKWLSTDTGVSGVMVRGETATLNGTTFSVTLPAGSSLPTASDIVIQAVEGATVSTLTTSDGGVTWSFTVTAGDGKTTATYTIQVTIAEQPSEPTTPDPEPSEPSTPSRPCTPSEPEEPSGPSTGDSDGWTSITDELDKLDPDTQEEPLTIEMNGETEVPKEVFETIAGKDVDVVFDMGDGVSWSVNGADIPADADFSNLDLGVSMNTDGIPVEVINAITGEATSVQITLAHDGDFGFALTLSAPLGEENAGYWANLYHYKVNGGEADREDPLGDNETSETMDFETAALIDDDGTANLRMTHASQYAIVIDDHPHETVLPFTDVNTNDWFYDPVVWAYGQGLMTGTSATTFEPNTSTTRAMIVAILNRLEDGPTADDGTFTDVHNGDWYADAVNWAASEGIVAGFEDGTFRPNAPITREQMAAILYNYAQWKGMDVSNRADLSRYSDQPSAWANDVMQWAVAEGLIAGTSATTLNPQGSATRAQVAAILERFLEN